MNIYQATNYNVPRTMLGIKDTKLKKKLFLFSRTPLSNRESRHVHVYMLINAIQEDSGQRDVLTTKLSGFSLFRLKVSETTSRLS